MKKNIILNIRNTKDGFHLNSKYWQEWKANLPAITPELREVAIGMILSDACMYKKSSQALIKFEQGYKQEAFILHLFSLFKLYCFMSEPGRRIAKGGSRNGLTKSFWFKTFSHYSFTEIWNLFYNDSAEGKKKIMKNLIFNNLSAIGLAYWVMGSLHADRKTMILHTQSYTKAENLILSKELNEKFGFNSKIIKHKEIYWVIKFNSKDAPILHNLIKPYLLSIFNYKLPIV